MRAIVSLLLGTLVWMALAGVASAQMVTIPNVMGKTEAEAREALTAAGVVGKIHAEVDKGGNCAQKGVEEGNVCGQSPGVAKQQAAFLDVWLVLQGRRAREEGEQVEAAPEIRMPAGLFGVTAEEAIERLVALGFTGAIDVQPSPRECKYAEGTVCNTEPSGRNTVPADADVIVYVQPKRTLDSYYARPPNVVGMPIAKAIDTAFTQNFRQIQIKFEDDVRCKPGSVCRMNDDPDDFTSRKSTLMFSIGTEYPGREKTPSYRMPDVRGDDLITVLKKVDAMGSGGRVGTDTHRSCVHEESEDLKPRTVCGQNPFPGRETSGTMIGVTLTADAVEAVMVASTIMPDVVGMSIDEATATLEAAGLTRTRVKEMSAPDCQPGTVCSTKPEAGNKAYAQTVQTLFIGATEATGADIGEAPVAAAATAGDER